MKKRIMLFVAVALLAVAFTGCGGPSIDSIKKAFDDAGYTTSSVAESDGAAIFTASKGTDVATITKCPDADTADAMEVLGSLGGSGVLSRKGLYVCIGTSAALEVFNSCF